MLPAAGAYASLTPGPATPAVVTDSPTDTPTDGATDTSTASPSPTG